MRDRDLHNRIIDIFRNFFNYEGSNIDVEERHSLITKDLDDFFGKKRGDQLRREGSTGLIPLVWACHFEDYKSFAESRRLSTDTAFWNDVGVRVFFIMPSIGSPLLIFTKDMGEGKLSRPYILDNDLGKSRRIFGGQK